tara:strand:- start:641 stop:1156 length:516 start_codon:yes stop_codon:yes gene_type:complete
VLQAQMIEGPGIKAFRNPQTRILSFMQGNVRFHRRYDARNDIGPNFVHIVDSGQNTIAPNDAAILGVDNSIRMRTFGPENSIELLKQYRTPRVLPIICTSASLSRNRKAVPRAMTNSHRRRESAWISSCGSASAMMASGVPPPRCWNGSTTIEGFVVFNGSAPVPVVSFAG